MTANIVLRYCCLKGTHQYDSHILRSYIFRNVPFPKVLKAINKITILFLNMEIWEKN